MRCTFFELHGCHCQGNGSTPENGAGAQTRFLNSGFHVRVAHQFLGSFMMSPLVFSSIPSPRGVGTLV